MLFTTLVIAFTAHLHAQEAKLQKTIHLSDTLPCVQYNVNQVASESYPPAHVFDGKLSTCWVYSTSDSMQAYIYLKVPNVKEPVLNLIGGYSKSSALFRANGRPAELQLSIYQAHQPNGMVSETGLGYQIFPILLNKTIELPDSLQLTSIPLTLTNKHFLKKLKGDSFPSDSTEQSTYILRLSFTKNYAGNKYSDNCLSELFFNDRFIRPLHQAAPSIDTVYTNKQETALYYTNSDGKQVQVYSDTTSILQLVELSPTKRWAVVIGMPREAEGRVETTYHLVDLWNRECVDEEFAKATGDYVPGAMVYFEINEQKNQELHYYTPDYQLRKVQLVE
jgi:hypothetical protein